MTARTEHLKRLAEAATPGHWFVASLIGGNPCIRADDYGRSICIGVAIPKGHEDEKTNHAFIAAANPSTVKALCELVEQMGEALNRAAKYEGYGMETEEAIDDALAALDAFQKGEGE